MQSMSRAGVRRRDCVLRYGASSSRQCGSRKIGWIEWSARPPGRNGTGIEAGEYEVRFYLDEFFASGAGASFLTVAPFRFRIDDVDEHFHLPMKFTRWGYSLFRGA